VGFEVAQALEAPLDVLPARKLRAPGRPELAIGAVAGDPAPALVWETEFLDALPVDPSYLQKEIAIQKELLKAMKRKFSPVGKPAPRGGRPLIVVDDGVATGSTARAALEYLRRTGAGPVVLALPVGPPETLARLRPLVHELICPLTPENFQSVGQFYQSFEQVSDEEVLHFLSLAAVPTVEALPKTFQR
jgi:predicted phosphoribosyltransferase